MNWMVAPEERARRDRIRTRLFTGMLLAYGYALLGGAVWEPITAGQDFGLDNLLIALLALAMHALALYNFSKRRACLSAFDVAVYVVAGAAVLTALAAMLTLRSLRQAEREIAERDRAQHAAQ